MIGAGDPTVLVERTRSGFASAFGEQPHLVARAPGRVNLIGEHTDYNHGLCLPVALGHATYAAVRARGDDLVRLATRQSDETWEGTLDAVGPGVSGWASYVAGVVWALREAGHDLPGVDVLVDSTVPLGAGLSSSAALECSVAAALADLAGLDLTDDDVRLGLVRACMRAESEVAGAPTGGMDQTVAMLARSGSALEIDFADDDLPRARQVALALDGLTLLVTDTRVSHALGDGGYASRRDDCERAARRLGVGSLREADLAAVERLDDEQVRRRARHVVTEIERVRAAVTALETGRVDDVGALFAVSHRSMRDDFEISCPELDAAVDAAVTSGALAARMTGGGFGGSSVAIVPDAELDRVVAAIDARFADAGFRAPQHLVATPSERAEVLVGASAQDPARTQR